MTRREQKREDRPMKRITVLFLMFVVAVPAMATDVTITAVAGPEPKSVTVGFTTSNITELVRAIALDVIVTDPSILICDINCVNPEYGIYPGSINIDATGTIADWGTCAGAGLESNTVASEQGSLYIGPANAPAQSGDLFIITLGGCTLDGNGEVTVSITEDAIRGGIVLENPDIAANVTLPGDVTVNMGNCGWGGCACMGDYTGPTGVPDGVVSTSDMGAMLGLLGAAGPPYVVSPIPAGWECMDLSMELSALPIWGRCWPTWAHLVRLTLDLVCPVVGVGVTQGRLAAIRG
jgi:hypothetical protein